MIGRLKGYFKKPEVVTEKPKARKQRMLSTDFLGDALTLEQLEKAWENNFSKSVTSEARVAMDASAKQTGFAMDNMLSTKASFQGQNPIPNQQLLWYANQSFIGWQLCALLSQQWLISKCCLMPAEDAIRNGYEVTINDGEDIESEVLDEIRKMDVKYKVNENLRQFVQMGRIFGIRIAMFKVESSDPQYYYNPFNPDGITPNSYKGIAQIDPYWITPQLDDKAAGDPASINFYEPTWWNVAGKLIHHTHLIIYRTEEVPDILKPTYIYGGIPIPQKIVERVYCAERTANEAPMLALTKRTDVISTDMAAATADPINFSKRLNEFVYRRDNYGIKAIDTEDKMEQFDTSLTDLDAVIMTQYQLVAAAANIPAVKLLGTSPKGFNATGEYEEASYHEMLESIQAHALTPLLERHHLLLMRSEIAPKFGEKSIDTCVVWKPLDAMTAKEQAELNKMKAETGGTLMNAGAIDGMDERARIINDPDSGYNGLIDEESPELIDRESDELTD